MRIHRLELNNVRGIEHLVLDDLPESGVVVIHGENEAGKSTIVEALDVVLTEKHSGRSKRIRALQPVGKDVAGFPRNLASYTFLPRGRRNLLAVRPMMSWSASSRSTWTARLSTPSLCAKTTPARPSRPSAFLALPGR